MPWLLLLAAGGIGLLILTRREADGGSVVSDIVDTVSSAVGISKRDLAAAVLPIEAQQYLDLAFRVGDEQDVDPLLILAVMQRESNFGLTLSPRGPAGTGDSGHGRGLMQIDDRSWTDWIRNNDWTDPYVNVTKGAQILKSNLRFFSGHGAVPGITDGYTVTLGTSHAAKRGVAPGQYTDPRPLSGTQLVEAAVAAYNSGPSNVLMSLAVGQHPDLTTAHGDYSQWVLQRLAEWSSAMG